MVLLPPEIKAEITTHLSTQQSLSRLAQSCRAWYEVATEELYKRDSRNNNSFAIKWMAAHAVDEQTTDSTLRTLETSRRWGGQIDAVKNLSKLNRQRSDKDQMMYESSTVLHFAVFLGNMRLTKMLLDMEASLVIPCPALIWKIMGAEELLLRVKIFKSILRTYARSYHCAFPIFLAFLQSDPDMCKLPIDYGAGREAFMTCLHGDSKTLSILQFAAVDRTTDYRQWQCLFDGFREYIDEPCPRAFKYTPLHVALVSGCTQGMQIVVENEADKVSRNDAFYTPLLFGVMELRNISLTDSKSFEEHARCLRKFVDLRAKLSPDGFSLIGRVVQYYTFFSDLLPCMRRLIYFLLECPTDIPGTGSDWRDTNVAYNIVVEITKHDHEPPIQAFLKELLSDLVDRGLSLTIPYSGFRSPLYRVLCHENGKLEWLVDFLCENRATIHEDEVDFSFFYWCHTPRLWEGNKYDAWWQHQGQEDENFQKWCEHPYNAWWWQHAKRISAYAATHAYQEAFRESRQLYDILTHLPVPRPSDNELVKMAFDSSKPWSWRLVVLLEFEDEVFPTWSVDSGENMIHLTVRLFTEVRDYSAAEASRDILHLRDKGVKMTLRNLCGETPRDILRARGGSRDGLMELAALLEEKVHEVHVMA